VRYDPDKWFGFALLLQSRGSVMLESLPSALFSTITVLVLHLVGYGPDPLGKDLTFAFNVVSFAFTFSLVTRMANSYNRFWEGRMHLATWTARVNDVAMCCKCFPKKSDTITILGVKHNVHREFQEEMSRMLCIFVGTCLQQMQEDPWDETQEWDSGAYEVDQLLTQTEMTALELSEDRALTVMSWIMDTACAFPEWNVPAPTQTRLHQQASEVLLAFNQCMKIVDTTLPFPMLQQSVFLLVTFLVSWPFLTAKLVTNTFWAMMVGFVPVSAFFGVHSVALELQDPYGDDANDLPLPQIHASMVRDIRILLEPWNFDFTERCAPGYDGPQATNDMF